MVLAMRMIIFSMLKITWSEMSWSESCLTIVSALVKISSIYSSVMLSFMRLHGIASSEESFHLRVILIVVGRLNHLTMAHLEFNVVELVWKTAMGSM